MPLFGVLPQCDSGSCFTSGGNTSAADLPFCVQHVTVNNGVSSAFELCIKLQLQLFLVIPLLKSVTYLNLKSL